AGSGCASAMAVGTVLTQKLTERNRMGGYFSARTNAESSTVSWLKRAMASKSLNVSGLIADATVETLSASSARRICWNSYAAYPGSKATAGTAAKAMRGRRWRSHWWTVSGRVGALTAVSRSMAAITCAVKLDDTGAGGS